MNEAEELVPWVTDTKLGEMFGWTEGQIRGYKDRLWIRNHHFALIGGRLMYNPTEVIKWQNLQVSDQRMEESKSGGSIKATSIPDLSIKRPRKRTSKMRLGSVKSSLSYAS